PVHVTMVELLFSGASSMRRTILSLAAILVFTFQMVGDEAPRRPGPTATGFLLPNGWTISPAGKQVTLTDLPLNIVEGSLDNDLGDFVFSHWSFPRHVFICAPSLRSLRLGAHLFC